MSASGTEVTRLLQHLWTQQKANGLADFAGLELLVQLPVTQSVVDDLVRPLDLPDGVRGLQVILAGHNLLRVEFTIAKFFLRQTIRIEARVDRAIGFPHEPFLELTLLTSGVVELVLNVIPLPDFVRLTGKQLRVDLGMLLRRSGNEWLIKRLGPIKVNIRPGILRLDAILTVPEAAQ